MQFVGYLARKMGAATCISGSVIPLKSILPKQIVLAASLATVVPFYCSDAARTTLPHRFPQPLCDVSHTLHCPDRLD